MDNIEEKIIEQFSDLLAPGDRLVVRLNLVGRLINHSRRPVSSSRNLAYRDIYYHCIGAKQYNSQGVFILSRNKEGFKVDKFKD